MILSPFHLFVESINIAKHFERVFSCSILENRRIYRYKTSYLWPLYKHFVCSFKIGLYLIIYEFAVPWTINKGRRVQEFLEAD
jgi:hypothetical protein